MWRIALLICNSGMECVERGNFYPSPRFQPTWEACIVEAKNPIHPGNMDLLYPSEGRIVYACVRASKEVQPQE